MAALGGNRAQRTPGAEAAGPADGTADRPKRLRFLLFNMPGRLVHHAWRLILRVAAVRKWTAAYAQSLRLLAVSP
ncbi:MAG: hypothetical protein ACLQVL_08085 [Terriglobia bacterium]